MHAGAHEGAPDGAPESEVGVGLPHAVCGGSVEGVACMARDEEEKGDKAHKVERSVAL